MKVLCFHSPFFKIINVNFLLSSSLRFFCMVIFGSDHNWNFAFYRVVRRNPQKLNIVFWKQIILYFCSNIQIRTTRCYWSLPVPLPSPSHQSTAVRNLYPFFVSQRPEVEFAPSPESSSSSFSLGFDLDTSSYPECNSMGVQDLLLYNSNTMLDTNMDNGSVTDWVEKTLSEVISQNFWKFLWSIIFTALALLTSASYQWEIGMYFIHFHCNHCFHPLLLNVVKGAFDAI